MIQEKARLNENCRKESFFNDTKTYLFIFFLSSECCLFTNLINERNLRQFNTSKKVYFFGLEGDLNLRLNHAFIFLISVEYL